MMIVNNVSLLVFWFSLPLLLDKIVNLVGLLVFWFSVPLLLDDDCESCWFADVLVLCSSASIDDDCESCWLAVVLVLCSSASR
jgi:hypothetical protein